MVAQRMREQEQLYMLEFLIHNLKINNEDQLSINVKFLDFDEFVINQEDFSRSPGVDFGCGKSCVFLKKPRDLMDDVRGPLVMEVRSVGGLIGRARLELTGCFCQLERGGAEPYAVRGTYDLVDDVEEPSGSVDLFLRLSCLGETVVTNFHVSDDSILFKNTNSGDEFSCVKLNGGGGKKEELWTPKARRIEVEKQPGAGTIIGISGMCQDLVKSGPSLESDDKKRLEGGRQERRLRGGTDGRCPPIPMDSMQALLPGLCRSLLREEETGCAGKFTRRGEGKRIPCSGIDCLIKSFREAERFVESIGKIPGVAGLGLPDPSESPYFGRRRPPARLTKRAAQALPLAEPRFKKLPTPSFDVRKPRREEVPPDFCTTEPPREVGPCGEAICESRKRSDKGVPEIPVMKIAGKSAKPKKRSPLVRKNEPLNERRAKGLKNYERNYGHIKVGKRVMRLVEAGSQRCCFGHRSCVEIRGRVPGNMGWLWNTKKTAGGMKPRIGWKPGAISRRVWRILERAKAGRDADDAEERPVSAARGKRGKLSKSRSLLSVTRCQRRRRENEEENELPPTLHIHRKNGDYYVTMYPVKSENFQRPEAQEVVKPIQFKVTKERNEDGCSAGSSSVGDDMEIEFSPPGAVQRYRKIGERREFESQVNQQEILDALRETEIPGKKKKPGKK